jgi:hypothetical protein
MENKSQGFNFNIKVICLVVRRLKMERPVKKKSGTVRERHVPVVF